MNTVERLARMTQQEREQFVEQLVTEWPDLADTVHTQMATHCWIKKVNISNTLHSRRRITVTTPTYHLDEDTESLVETALAWAQQVVDLQLDDEVKEEMSQLLTDLAHRMNIQVHEVKVTEEEHENGDLTVHITRLETNAKPKLRVIDGDKDRTPIDEDDDGKRH